MTAIGRYRAPSAEPGRLGVHSIGEFVLSVPAPEKAQEFYAAFGLDVTESGNALALSAADGYRWGRVVGGRRKALHHLTFHCFEEDLPRFKARLEEARIPLLSPPPGFDSNGLWFADPDGLAVEIRVGPKTSPDGKAPPAPLDGESGVRCAPYRRFAEAPRPRRLSHLLRFTADVDRMVGFYDRTLGLKLSDRSGGNIAFLHAIHGSDHHMVAFARSGAPGLHHVSWDMPSLDSVGLGAMTMAERGWRMGWGLGRHVLGSNYFHYVRDPWGSFAEYSFNIDYIPASAEWEPIDHPGEDSFYLWGPEMPPEFVFNAEAAQA
ncbi:MAG: VOC family protein [Rhodospirillales bacterium]|nr:VOC family protein [Rhodospirillales bacterium]